jgi:hypothetical protein
LSLAEQLPDECRWLQDPMFDIESLPAITKTHSIRPEDLRMVTKPIPSLFKPNLPKNSSKTPHPPVDPRRTETLGAREVFYEIQSAIRPLMTHAETREQVDNLLRSIDGIR